MACLRTYKEAAIAGVDRGKQGEEAEVGEQIRSQIRMDLVIYVCAFNFLGN